MIQPQKTSTNDSSPIFLYNILSEYELKKRSKNDSTPHNWIEILLSSNTLKKLYESLIEVNLVWEGACLQVFIVALIQTPALLYCHRLQAQACEVGKKR